VSELVPWEKAYAQNGFNPEMLSDPGLPDIHITLLTDHLEGLADARFGAGRWAKRDDVEVTEYEPLTRDREYEDTDDDWNPIVGPDGEPVIVRYHDDNRYFRMTAWFRAKAEGE
jgi:hypothetical protein